MDDGVVQSLIYHMQFRGKDPTFTRMRDAYLDLLTWHQARACDHRPVRLRSAQEKASGADLRIQVRERLPDCQSDLMEQARQIEWWLAAQRRSVEEGTFFGACNYYAYIVTMRGMRIPAQRDRL